jgi:hypothetical protein
MKTMKAAPSEQCQSARVPKTARAMDIENPAFQEVIELLSDLSLAANGLTSLEVLATDEQKLVIDKFRSEYISLQNKRSAIEARLEIICRTHPAWFTEKKTLKTPYGSVSLRDSSELSVPNEELTMALIESQKAERYIRYTKSLDLEALEKLDDTTLAHYKILRITKSNFTAKPTSLDLGKAVKDLEPKP